MIEPTARDLLVCVEMNNARIRGPDGASARILAAYREELLAASAQSAEPQEAETLIDIRHRLYAEAEERSGGWSKWTPNEAFKTGFESGIDATFYALRARLASKPSREEALARYMKIRDEAQENPVCPSREEEMREQIERIKHDCENALRSSTHHKCDYLSLIQSINDRLELAALADEAGGKP
jgi:hypothetical protein